MLGGLNFVSDGFDDLAVYARDPIGAVDPSGFEVLDPEHASQLVRRFPPWELRRLRDAVDRDHPFGTPRDALEDLVRSGQLVVARRPMPRGSMGPPAMPTDLVDLAEPREEIAQPKKVDTFAAFRLVDDGGNPIADQPFTLELPDGRTIDGTTGPDGHFEVEDVTQRGNCVLRFEKAA